MVYGMNIDNPEVDIVKLSESFGVEAERVNLPSEIRPALERALASGMPAVVDVRADPV